MSGKLYEQDALALVESVSAIHRAFLTNGFGTQTIATVLGEFVAVTGVVQAYLDLPGDQRDEFFGEVFDQAIGNEPAALVSQAGPLGPDVLEAVSDALKEGLLAYLNAKAGD